MRRMANSVNDEVVGFNSALKEASVFRNLIFLVHQNRKKKKQLLHWFWKGSTGRVAKWLWEKPFHQSMPVCIKQIMARKTSNAVVCASKYRLRSIGRKQSNRLTEAILKDCRLEQLECRKHQLIFVTARRFRRSNFVPGGEKTTLPFHSSTLYVFFCRKTLLSVLI